MSRSSEGAKPVPFSRPLDVHRWSDYPEMANCLGQLVAEIEEAEQRQRRRSGSAVRKLREAVRCLVLDLYVAHTTTPDYEVGVSLAKGAFHDRSRYGVLFLTYDTFYPAFRGLEALDYLQVTRPGFHDPVTGKGRTTKVRATEKLIDLLAGKGRLTRAAVSYRTGPGADEPIVLRGNDKQPIDYDDDVLTHSMRAEVERINAHLAQAWIDLYLSDRELDALNARMRADHAQKEREAGAVDFAAKRLRRIFNNGDWSQGGRFYGGWWQHVPREFRRYITIDGKPTVEIDYSGMHPTLLYAEAGAELKGDAYDVGLPSIPRDTVKRTFNKLINAEGRIVPTPDYDEGVYGLSWHAFVEKVMRRHEPIRQFFKTGHGVRLQNTDARIANRIMLRFLEMGYVCLPVHDSFIVHHALRDELAGIMADEFRKEAGVGIGAKTKLDFLSGYVPARDQRNIGTEALDDLLGGEGEYAQYDTREADWRSRLGAA